MQYDRYIADLTLMTEQGDSKITISSNMFPLAGTFINSCGRYTLADQICYLFTFPDISVNMIGTFRLKCTVTDISFALANSSSENLRDTDREAMHICSVTSQKFCIYSEQNFPGVLRSTDLTIILAKQGMNAIIHRKNTLTVDNVYLAGI